MKLRLNRYHVSIAAVNLTAALMLLFILAPFASAPVTAHIKHAPAPKKAVKKVISGVPERIVIPSLSLDIRVKTGSFNPRTKQWTISDKAAYYANYSVLPNNASGTTLIYGHARWGLFGALPDLTQHADVYLHTKNKQIFHYKYVSSVVVEPDNTDIFSSNGKPQLVLQTCSGTWSQYRALYRFSLVNVTM